MECIINQCSINIKRIKKLNKIYTKDLEDFKITIGGSTIYKVYPTSDKAYKKVLLINYLSNQLFTILFFNLENLFLSFVDTVIVFMSSLYLYEATYNYDKSVSKYLIPYIIWNLFALILSLTITVMN